MVQTFRVGDCVREVSRGAFAGFFRQTPALFEHPFHAAVHQFGDDAVPLAAGRQDAQIGQPLKLIGNSLSFHPERIGEVSDAQLLGPYQCVQQPQIADRSRTP